MNRKCLHLFYLLLLLSICLAACKEEVCPDVCSESLYLKAGQNCDCVCTSSTSFNQLVEKWGNNRICITKFAETEDPYILLSHQANYLTCDRSDYLMLYMDNSDRIPHPEIPDAELGFLKVNFYGELSRNLWAYTSFQNNDTLYTGFGSNPTVSNRSFLCDEPAFHSSKWYYAGDLLNMEKYIYGTQSDWENETNPVENYHFTFHFLAPVN